MSRRAQLPMSVNLMANGPIGQVVELAKLAEEVGCRRCWVYDEGLATRDVYVTLAAIAGATEHIALGPGITNPYVRHPGATAAAIATLDELSGARAFLGLGAGGGLTLGPLAIDRRRPVASVGGMIEDLRSLWRGDEVTVERPTYSLTGARLAYGRDDIGIIVAGRGERMVAIGGERADGFYLSYVHKPALATAVGSLRAMAAAGPRGDRFEIVYSTKLVTSAADHDAARADLSFRLVDSPPDVRAAIGMTDHHVDAIRAALAAGGPKQAAANVDESWVDEFVIVGSTAEVGAELRATIERHGIDDFQVPVVDLDSGAATIESVAAMLSTGNPVV